MIDQLDFEKLILHVYKNSVTECITWKNIDRAVRSQKIRGVKAVEIKKCLVDLGIGKWTSRGGLDVVAWTEYGRGMAEGLKDEDQQLVH